ncbi:hypothetical protein ACP70R_027456 [Stipagrostis hirtigluma subsp. patula]
MMVERAFAQAGDSSKRICMSDRSFATVAANVGGPILQSNTGQARVPADSTRFVAGWPEAEVSNARV